MCLEIASEPTREEHGPTRPPTLPPSEPSDPVSFPGGEMWWKRLKVTSLSESYFTNMIALYIWEISRA